MPGQTSIAPIVVPAGDTAMQDTERQTPAEQIDEVLSQMNCGATITSIRRREMAMARADTDPVRPDLTAEAIRLARLVRALMPEDGEVAGLRALMLLIESRWRSPRG